MVMRERDEKEKQERDVVKELWTDNGSREIPRGPDSSLYLWEIKERHLVTRTSFFIM